MNVLRVLTPLSDITNLHYATINSNNANLGCRILHQSGLMREPSPIPTASRYQHDPYNWKCLPDVDAECEQLLTVCANGSTAKPTVPLSIVTAAEDEKPVDPQACRCLIQFKCHQAEFSSGMALERGQYVVVQGDRGIDIGVVIRINTDTAKTYVERTGPCGSVMRHATQREVDYWASELKADENIALEFCRQRIIRNTLPMEVRHAEYQFDKKKLTFYYDAKTRVDFVNLLKELYREYGCRIWMEKVRAHE